MARLKNNIPDLKDFLDEKSFKYESPSFIKDDPILIPHRFTNHNDIEVSAFITSVISWGNRKSIINSSNRILDYLDNSPYDFIMNHKQKDLNYFIKSLKNIYNKYGGIEHIVSNRDNGETLQERISYFKEIFFSLNHPERTKKHLPSPLKGSSAKRFNMFLRWMVRSNERGVDFGIWNKIDRSELSIPLDVHTGRIARELGILNRNLNDHKSVNEIDLKLREMDPIDPVKYDYALFGLGVYENF
ncbi:TIGR02757 family protein [Flavobacteriaceae bacterium]|nr:TIGR02757 family protein [Flavobacteriaceae bacterium]